MKTVTQKLITYTPILRLENTRGNTILREFKSITALDIKERLEDYTADLKCRAYYRHVESDIMDQYNVRLTVKRRVIEMTKT